MASSALPQVTAKVPSANAVPYVPQTNDDDEEGGYMLLVPIRKKPYVQLFLSFAAMVLAIAGLARDEIMDGSITFSSTYYWYNLKEVDYDCGFQELRFTYVFTKGYKQSESYRYSSSLCEQNEYIFSNNFCSDQNKLGKVWLGCGIVGIIFNAISMLAIHKQGPRSKLYLLLITLSTTFYCAAAFDWMANERCNDLENYSNATITLDTTLGSSLILIIVAAGLCMFGMLLTLFNLIRARVKHTQENDIPLSNLTTTQVTQ